MRVLITSELYRTEDASANATLNDARTWVEEWLRIDDRIHVYWLLPPRERANYEAEYVHADHDQVTLIEARSFMSGEEYEYAFTESGYTEEQLIAIREEIFDQFGYVDIVIDQLRRGREDLVKWLLLQGGHDPRYPDPFSVIVNVHDLLLPWKYPESKHQNAYQRKTEVANAALADGIWFKARIDADGMQSYACDFLNPSLVHDALRAAVQTNSPIDLTAFREEYREEPHWFHIAGSLWEKKQTDVVFDVGRALYEQFGIRTVMTSMGDIPSEYSDHSWVEAYPRASRDTYERMLRKGDLAVCASDYDTLARTWFEQAASGQVLVVRDTPWVYESIPSDYRLLARLDDLEQTVLWAVEHWDEAVAENRRLVEHVRKVRNPQASGRRTYRDMARRVLYKVSQYRRHEYPVVERTLMDLDTDRVDIREVSERTAAFTTDGRPLLERDDYSRSLLVFALRSLGYVDLGNPGTPLFQNVRSANPSRRTERTDRSFGRTSGGSARYLKSSGDE